MSFNINCPHCKRALNVTEPAFGKTVPCPGCKQPIKVPHPAAVPSSPPNQRAATQAGGAESRSQDPFHALLDACAATWAGGTESHGAQAPPPAQLPPSMPSMPDGATPDGPRGLFILNPVPPRHLPTAGHQMPMALQPRQCDAAWRVARQYAEPARPRSAKEVVVPIRSSQGDAIELPRLLRFWIQALFDSLDRATRLVVGRLPVGPWTDDPGGNVRPRVAAESGNSGPAYPGRSEDKEKASRRPDSSKEMPDVTETPKGEFPRENVRPAPELLQSASRKSIGATSIPR